MTSEHIPSVRSAIDLPGTRKDVFNRFVGGFGRWWPMSYTFSEDRFESAEIQPRAGGHWSECSLDGERTDWGEVRVFEPGRRLVLSFAISPDRQPTPPEQASEVEIRFLPSEKGTRIELEHRHFEKHGEGAKELRDGMASGAGWPLILASFAREVRDPG